VLLYWLSFVTVAAYEGTKIKVHTLYPQCNPQEGKYNHT